MDLLTITHDYNEFIAALRAPKALDKALLSGLFRKINLAQ